MPLGNSDTSKIYLNISFGKLRQKATESTPGAISRVNKLNETVWEKVYGWITGKITGIYYKEHAEYGNSYEVTINDGQESYNVSLNEDSKYCRDFLSKLPNIDLNRDVTLSPYDFKPQGEDRNIKGLSIKQDEIKLENYFIKKDENNGLSFLHGYPERDGELSKSQWKIYSIKVQEFLNEYTKANIIPTLSEQNLSNVSNEPIDDSSEDDDLPF